MVLLSMNFHRVPRDVSQGPIPELIPFPIYTLADGMQGALSKFADDPKLGGKSCQGTGGFCCLEGHPEAGRMGFQKLQKASLAIGKEQSQDRCPGS